jgi:hypothetical protein
MTVVRLGTFTAGDRFQNPDDQFARIRQDVVVGLHQSIDDAKNAWLFPRLLVEAMENEIWKYPRQMAYELAPPMPLLDFIRAPYPRGLGTTRDVVERLIADDEAAKLHWDRAVRGDHGGAHNPTGINQHSEADQVNVDNVNVDQMGTVRPVGNSAQAGLRRLDRAAQAGNEQAATMLAKVLDGSVSVNAACIALGWRPKTQTVVDTAEGLIGAAVRRFGALDTVMYAWYRADAEGRDRIVAWIREQTADVADDS